MSVESARRVTKLMMEDVAGCPAESKCLLGEAEMDKRVEMRRRSRRGGGR